MLIVGLGEETVGVRVAVMEDVAARTGPRHAGGPAVSLVPLVTPALVLPRLVLVLTARLLMAVLLSPALVLGPATPHCGHQWSSPGPHCRAEEVIVREERSCC